MTQTLAPSYRIPYAPSNPVKLVVCPVSGLIFDTEDCNPASARLAVQMNAPSVVIPSGRSPNAVDTTSTEPGGCFGSMRYRLPGNVVPAMKIRPLTTTTPWGLVASGHVPNTLPSLARARETVLLVRLTQRSAPSDCRLRGCPPRVVTALRGTTGGMAH